MKEVKRAKLPPALRKDMLERLTKPSGSEWGGAPKVEVEALIRSLVNRDKDDAARLAKSLHARFPDVGLITSAYATSFEMNDNPESADVFYRRAILQAPFDVSIRMNYGRFLRLQSEDTSALIQFRRADELRPNTAEIMLSKAEAAVGSGQPKEALDNAVKVVAMKPDMLKAKHVQSKALSNLNQSQEAVSIDDELVKSSPNNPAFWLQRGLNLQYLGNFKDAEYSFQKALELDPNRASIYRELSAIRKFEKDDPLFEKLLIESKRETLTDGGLSGIHFAFGKMYEDTKNAHEAFAHIKKANEYDTKIAQLNKSDVQNRHASHRDFKDKLDLREVSDSNPESGDPIFVTGLPRSGTNLTEQLIAAHSTTKSVGEARWWNAALADLWTDIASNSYDKGALAKRLQQAGQDYMALAELDNPQKGRIVDKALMKHETMGLVLAAMPKARVVVLKRDPRDNLLSIYKNQFNSKVVPFNNDFDALAWTYSKFLDFIDFSSEVFPDRIYTLDYDALTADPEKISREVLEFCGLEWEDDVLNFHTQKNTVKTLSAFQVRQPIYRSSVRSWEKYGDELKPLFEALEGYGVPLPD